MDTHQTMQPRKGMLLLGSGKLVLGELCDMLDGVDLFAEFEWGEIEGLARYFQPYRVEAECSLFRQGEPGDFLCVLIKGKIRAYKERDAHDSVLISTESAGRCIGEMALIDNEPRSATCVAEEESTVVLLTREAYQRLAKERPALALKLLQRIARLISRRLRVTSGRLTEHIA